MISPQMSAWVRVWAWAWARAGGDVSFYLGGPFLRRTSCRSRALEGRRAAGGRWGLRAYFGSPGDLHNTRCVWGLQPGSAESLSKKNNKKPTKKHQHPPPKTHAPQKTQKKEREKKGGKRSVCWAAVLQARRCRQRGAAAARGRGVGE